MKRLILHTYLEVIHGSEFEDNFWTFVEGFGIALIISNYLTTEKP